MPDVLSVTFPSAIGGDDSTISVGSDPNTGLAGDGHRKRFLPMLQQVINIVSTCKGYVETALAAAASAVNAPGTSATSTSTLGTGTGTKTLTIQTGKAFSKGQTVVIASTATPTTQMVGVITDYVSGTGVLTVSVTLNNLVGNLSAFTVSLSAIAGFDPNAKADKTAVAAADADIIFAEGF